MEHGAGVAAEVQKRMLLLLWIFWRNLTVYNCTKSD